MHTERRADYILRKLVITGNGLAMWAGRQSNSPDQEIEIASLLNAWDKTLAQLREERREIEHVSL